MARTKRHVGSIEKRGNSFRVTLSVDNVIHRFTVATTDRKLAEKAAEQRHSELREQAARKAVGLPDVIIFSALLSEFENGELLTLAPGTISAYRDSLTPIRAHFVDKLGDLPVNTIRSSHIASYLDWRATSGDARRRESNKTVVKVSARTVNKERRVLHRLFEVATRREYCEANPVKKTRARKVDDFEPVILDDAEYARLLAKCAERSPMLHLYTLLLGETGMRSKSEALHLQWSDVDLANKRITIKSGRDGHRTKSGKSRVVPMTASLASRVRDYFAEYHFTSNSAYIFAHTGNERSGQRIAGFRFAIEKAASAAKISPDWRLHDLRHRRVTTWLGAGKSPVAVQAAMGHSTITTTMGYYKFLPSHLTQLVDETPAVAAVVGA